MDKKTNIQVCKNCGAQLRPGAHYCHNCGQNVKDKKISIKSLFFDFVGNIFNFDLKFFKTLKALMVPGKLTVEYFRGKYVSYLSPWRLFFISIVIMLIVVNVAKYLGKEKNHDKKKIVFTEFNDKNFKKIDSIDFDIAEINKNRGGAENIVDFKVDTFGKKHLSRQEILKIIPDTLLSSKIKDIHTSIDSAYLYSDMTMRYVLDSAGHILDNGIREIYYDSTVIFNKIKVSKFDLKHLSLSQLREKYKIDANDISATDLLIFNFIYNLKSKKFDQRKFLDFIIKNLNWFIILLLPFAALIFKLLYLRRKKYFVEHLVFNIHNHSAILLLIAFVNLLMLFNNSFLNLIAMTIILLVPAIYYILAMKRFYGQSWFKTVMKFSVFIILYFLILSLAMIVYTVIGAWMAIM